MSATPDSRADDARRMAGIRTRLAALDARGLQLVSVDGCMALEAAGRDGELTLIARFEPAASPDEMEMLARAADDLRFLLALLARAAARIRALDPDSSTSRSEGAPVGRRTGGDARSGLRAAPDGGGPKDFAAEAAMKCAEPAFAAFMGDRHGLERPLTADRVAQRLRSVLGVDSRARLNDDDAAAARWKALRGEFEAWRRAG